MEAITWNPWHGCIKISEGCKNCYVFRRDNSIGIDSSIIRKTCNFNLPIKTNRKKAFKIPSGSKIWTCFTSDFFLTEADDWRKEAWGIMKIRSDLHFVMVTKRINRIVDCLPQDWGNGYENISIGCTVENQKQVDLRLPIYRDLPIKHKFIICEPLLERIDLNSFLDNHVTSVIVGGESGNDARPCNFEWVKNIQQACINNNVTFIFKQTGSNFIKDGKSYTVPRKHQHIQAKKAEIDYIKINI